MKEDILSQIKVVFNEIDKQGKANDALGLLRSANQLSSLRYNLGDLWVTAKQQAEQLEHNYKSKVDSRMLELREEGKTIEEAKAQARSESSPDYRAYLDAERQKNELTAIRDDLGTKISVLQSYSSELRSQKTFSQL